MVFVVVVVCLLAFQSAHCLVTKTEGSQTSDHAIQSQGTSKCPDEKLESLQIHSKEGVKEGFGSYSFGP